MNTIQSSVAASYAILQDMGIPLWAKRPKASNLFFLQPKLFAPLLVVLQKQVEDHSEAQKVFQGMLKVLNLLPEEICIAWVDGKVLSWKMSSWKVSGLDIGHGKVSGLDIGHVKSQDLTPGVTPAVQNAKAKVSHIAETVQYWQPRNILILGHSLAEQWALSNIKYFVTHHPEELVQVPQAKREAYKVLLSLKESLKDSKHIDRIDNIDNRGVPNA